MSIDNNYKKPKDFAEYIFLDFKFELRFKINSEQKKRSRMLLTRFQIEFI